MFLFLYTSREKGLISFIKSYIESSANAGKNVEYFRKTRFSLLFHIDLKDTFTLNMQVILSALLTAFIHGGHLLRGMHHYKQHKLEMYKGFSFGIPSAKKFKWNVIVSNSVHYAGFLIGYMVWSFVIWFHIILFLLVGFEIRLFSNPYIKLAITIFVPIIVFYMLKRLIMSSSGRGLFSENVKRPHHLENIKSYAVFVYINFFAGKLFK